MGTIIKIRCAALTTGTVAAEAKFLSFATNEPTPTPMSLSRGDYTKLSKGCGNLKIVAADPFGEMDREGGQSMRPGSATSYRGDRSEWEGRGGRTT